MREHLEEELFVETGELAVGGDGEKLVAEIHEDAVVSGGMVGECDAELAGHERRIARGDEQVIEACEELVAGGVIEREPAPDARAEWQELGGAEPLGHDRRRRQGSSRREQAELQEEGDDRLVGSRYIWL